MYLLTADAAQSTVVGLLSLYAVAGYKLLPTLQQIYRAVSSISAHGEVALKLLPSNRVSGLLRWIRIQLPAQTKCPRRIANR